MVDISISPTSLQKNCVKDSNDNKFSKESIIPIMVTSQLCVIGNSQIDVLVTPSNKSLGICGESSESEKKLSTRSYKKHKRHRRNRKAGRHHQKISKAKRNLSMNIRRAIIQNPPDLPRSHNGRPMAPYNTTQFIMEQNNIDAGSPRLRSLSDEPDWISTGDSSTDSDSCSTCLSEGQLTETSDDEMDPGFIKVYDDVNTERLHCMSKEDLVKECIELDAKNTNLERELRSNRRSSSSQSSS